MLRALLNALKLDAENLKLHSCLTRFIDFVSKSTELKEPVKKVLDQSMPEVLRGRSSLEFNQSFLENHANNLEAVLIGSVLLVKLDPSQAEAAVKLATNLDPSLANHNIKTCTDVLAALKGGELAGAGKDAVKAYKEACSKLFVYSTDFKDAVVASSETNNHVENLAAHVETVSLNN